MKPALGGREAWLQHHALAGEPAAEQQQGRSLAHPAADQRVSRYLVHIGIETQGFQRVNSTLCLVALATSIHTVVSIRLHPVPVQA